MCYNQIRCQKKKKVILHRERVNFRDAIYGERQYFSVMISEGFFIALMLCCGLVEYARIVL